MCDVENVAIDLEGVGRVREVVHTVAIPRDDGFGEDRVRFVEGDGGELLVIANGLLHDCYGYATAVEQLRSVLPSSIRNGYERFDVAIPDVDPCAPLIPDVDSKVRRAIGLTELGFVDLSRKRSKSKREQVVRVYRALRADDFVRNRWRVVREHDLDDRFDSMFPGIDEFPDGDETPGIKRNGSVDLQVIRETSRTKKNLGTVTLLSLRFRGDGYFWGISWSSLRTYFKYKGDPVLSHWKNGTDYVVVRDGDEGSKDYVLRGECLAYNIRNRQSASLGRALLARLPQGNERWSEVLGLGSEIEPEVKAESDSRRAFELATGDSVVRSYTYTPEHGEPYGVNVAFFSGIGPAVSLADLRKSLAYDSHVPLSRMKVPADYVNSATSVPGLSGARRFATRSGYEKAYRRRVRSKDVESEVRRFDAWFWRTVAPDIGWELPERWRDADSDVPDGGLSEVPDDSESPVQVEHPVDEVPIGTGIRDEDGTVLTDKTLEKAEVEREVDSEPTVPEVSVKVAPEVVETPIETPEPMSIPEPEKIMPLVYGGNRGCVRVRFGCCRGVVFAVGNDFLGLVGNSESAREALGKLEDYEVGEKNVGGTSTKVVAEFGMYRVLDTVRFYLRALGRDTSEVDAVYRWLATEAIPCVREYMTSVPSASRDPQGFADWVRDQIVEIAQKNTDLVNQVNEISHRPADREGDSR